MSSDGTTRCGKGSDASSERACLFPSPMRCTNCVCDSFYMTTIILWLSPTIEPLPIISLPRGRPAGLLHPCVPRSPRRPAGGIAPRVSRSERGGIIQAVRVTAGRSYCSGGREFDNLRPGRARRHSMSRDETEDNTIYKVVVNHEEQYSIWPAERENALGWHDAGKTGTKQECLAYIEEVWTDMRPLSLRQKMESGPA